MASLLAIGSVSADVQAGFVLSTVVIDICGKVCCLTSFALPDSRGEGAQGSPEDVDM